MINRALLILAGVLLALGASEVLMRVALPRDRFSRALDATYRPDPVLFRVHVADSQGHGRADLPEDGFDARYRYDQHGMRGQNGYLDDPHSDPAVTRIMLLGDSYVEQRQLDDADLIQTRLGRMLADRGAPAPRVFAYGVSGWSPVEYDLYYKTQARSFRPAILFVFLTFNDYRDDAIAAAGCVFASSGEVLGCPAPIDAYTEARQRARPSFWMLLDLYRHLRDARAWTSPGMRDLLGSDFRMDGSDELLAFLDARRIDSTMPMMRRSFMFLRELFGVARRDGVTPVLVMVPWPQQVAAGEWSLGRPMWGVPVNRLEPSTVLQDMTIQAAREAGMETLDLLPALRERAARDRLFFSFDGHFTAAGSNAVAGALAEAVLKVEKTSGSKVGR
jgi:hypothetical protein